MKKKAFGIVLLVLAAWILLQGNFGIPSLDGKIWPFTRYCFFVYKSIESILRQSFHFSSAFFTGLLAVLMIANYFW